MDNVYRELDEVKTELEKLKAECRNKTELSESLKKAQNEQLLRFQEAKGKIEKQAQELNFKSEEITEERKLNEDLKSSLHEKEAHIRQLSSVNEKVRVECAQKLLKLEEGNKELALALDEMKARNKALEQNFCASNQEVGDLKKLLLIIEKKCSEAEVKAQEAKELRQRDDIILKLEEKNRNMLDKLKWKSEQFKHLEEAHGKLRSQFQLNKDEWEKEKLALLEGISSLQTSLNSKTRMIEGLQSRLEMCNQALAHEESKRKFLEVEVSEFKSRFEDVFAQCQEEKSKIQDLTFKRDEEIAKLRSYVGEKETLSREMELRIVHLDQENQELRESLKELREAQIHNAGDPSLLLKLRHKLRGLEQVHKKCSSFLKTKESEWSLQVEKMEGDISSYKSKLNMKEIEIQKLQMDIENCHSTIEVLNEEISMVHLIYKSEFSGAYSKILSAEAEKEVHVKENKDKTFVVAEQVELKENTQKALDLMQDDDEITFLKRRIESLEHTEQHILMMEEELHRQKKFLEESSEGRLQLKGQLSHMETALRDEKRDAYEALQKVKFESAEKNHELCQLENELQNWKSTTEILKACLEENEETRKQMETSLLAGVENEQTLRREKESLLCIVIDQERKVDDLKQQIVLLEASNAEKMKEMEAFKQQRQNLLLIAEEKDSCIKNHLEDITHVKQESKRRESEAVKNASISEQEKVRLLEATNEKDRSVKYFQSLAMSLEQDLIHVLISSFSEQVEKEVEASMLAEALKNAECASNLELKERDKIIEKLEMEHSNLLHKVAYQEETFLHLKQEAEQLQVLLEANKLETAKFMEELRKLEGLVRKLKSEKETLLQERIVLSEEREASFAHLEEMCDRIDVLSVEDAHLMKTLEAILHIAAEDDEVDVDSVLPDKLYDSPRENVNASFSVTTKKLEVNLYGRSPLKEVNSWQM
ncbi:basic helix-loop-helix (bHLH) DNA-binding superfamily protein [Quillaja saponaria]|uniref:Basic helix-loop-helix (BHLH) DNA-binding superfamily protein n=1 Tax=Quillaja saponaria TaxID=32244 RepID=A0AAD7KVW2_QUISA|nr:basic helix-loop-helix (bHLH) DNA-binding superfamily protein [Quillaja saponaria]